MDNLLGATKRLIVKNARSLRWWHWLLMLLWEGAVTLATIQFVRVSGGWSGEGALWAFVFFALPLSQFFVPLRVQTGVTASVTAEPSATRRTSEYGTAGLIALALGFAWFGGAHMAVWLAPESEWAYEWRYSLDHELKGADVDVQPKPHDCEFLTAPLGSKHCHYTPEVVTVRIRSQKTGRVVSYDEGRTWSDAPPSAKRSVYVSWQKVQD